MEILTSRRPLFALASVLVTLALASCSSPGTDSEGHGETSEAIAATSSFLARGTGYYPDSSPLEGGFVDRRGAPLRTLQQFLSGKAAYVSVAMDVNAFSYGQRLRINELDAKYGKAIVFRVVDTGGAFSGKGRSRIDICTANESASLDPTINGSLHIDVIDEKSGPELDPPADPPSNPPSNPPSDPPADADPAECREDGDCNPGNDGSGKICEGGKCVPGCNANWQCPGATTCRAGECR
jgi:hypothetical protein